MSNLPLILTCEAGRPSKCFSDNLTLECKFKAFTGTSSGTAIDSVWGSTIAVMSPFYPSVVLILIVILL